MTDHPSPTASPTPPAPPSTHEDAALQHALMFYRAAFRAFPGTLAIAIYDRELRFLVVEGDLFSELGFAVAGEAAIAADATPPLTADHAALRTTMLALCRGTLDGTPGDDELTLGEQVQRVEALPLHDKHGALIGGMVQVCDVTSQKRVEQQRRLFATIVANTGANVAVGSLTNGYLTYVNAAHQKTMGYTIAETLKLLITDSFAEEPTRIQAEIALCLKQGYWQGVLIYRRKDGSTFPAFLSAFIIYDPEGRPEAIAGVFQDISQQQEAEQERAALQQQIIDSQQVVLRELSTPLIPIADNVVIMPLIGNIDTHRAQDMLEVLLGGVAQHGASTAIIDITGVPFVDSQVANAIVRAAAAVKLLGARVILTGIRPEVAQTMVGLGIDLQAITTRSTLQNAVLDVLAQNRR